MKELTDKLAAIGPSIDEEDQVVTLLGSLPQSYSTFVMALEARVDGIKLDFVQQALLHEEQKYVIWRAALIERLRNPQNQRCYHFGQPAAGHFRRDCPKESSRTMVKQCIKPRLQERNLLKRKT